MPGVGKSKIRMDIKINSLRDELSQLLDGTHSESASFRENRAAMAQLDGPSTITREEVQEEMQSKMDIGTRVNVAYVKARGTLPPDDHRDSD